MNFRKSTVTILVILMLTAMIVPIIKAEYLTSDKLTYYIGEDNTAILSGSEFTPGSSVTIRVTIAEDSTYLNISDPIIVGDDGTFTYNYNLPGIIGTYTATALDSDGNALATTTFLDPTQVNTTVTLNTISSPLASGQTGVSFSGTVGSTDPKVPDGAPVYLQYRVQGSGGAFIQIATTTTSGGSGSFSSTFTAPATANNYEFQVSFPVFKQGNDIHWKPSTSASQTITVTSPDTTAPTSSVTAFGRSYTNAGSIAVSYTASDGFGTGVANVHLWVEVPGASAYTDAGLWTSGATYTFGATDGLYSFYTIATDNAGNVETAPTSADATIFVDRVAPTSSVTDFGSIYTKANSIIVSYTDNDASPSSGVANVHLFVKAPGASSYSDAGLWTTGSSYTLGSTDGLYSFYTIATDNAGNTETAKSSADAAITVDRIAPSSHVTGFGSTYTNAGGIAVAFSASDGSGSGIANVHLWVKVPGASSYADAGPWTSGDSYSFTSGDGIYSFYTIATDNAGNVESAPASADATITADITGPTTSAAVTSGTSGSNGWYITTVGVTITPSDATSGIANTYYRLDGSSWQIYSGGEVSVIIEGTTTISYYSVDNAGNTQATQTLTVKLDTQKPKTFATITSGTSGSNGWYTTDVGVTINPYDATSGVASTYYSLDGSTWHAYTSGEVTVSAQGTTTFSYYSIDNAGLTQATQTLTIKIDTQKPTTSAAVTSGTSGSNGWYITTVGVTITPSDATSGVASTKYSLDGTTWHAYTGGEVSVATEGTTTVSYYSVDKCCCIC